jgi:hypothetical protein
MAATAMNAVATNVSQKIFSKIITDELPGSQPSSNTLLCAQRVSI